jgi:hypothetical protein
MSFAVFKDHDPFTGITAQTSKPGHMFQCSCALAALSPDAASQPSLMRFTVNVGSSMTIAIDIAPAARWLLRVSPCWRELLYAAWRALTEAYRLT